MGKRASKPARGPVEITLEDFERQIYDALLSTARGTSATSRAALGSCVALGLPWDSAPPAAKAEVRRFIAAAGLLEE